MQEYFTNTFMIDNTNDSKLLTSGSPIPESYPEETRTSSGSNCNKTEVAVNTFFCILHWISTKPHSAIISAGP